MFHFPRLAMKPYCIQTSSTRHYPRWVFPFGNLRIKAYLPLPEAYRSLSRPSSPADAKASIMRPFELDQNCYKLVDVMSYVFLILCMFIYGEEYFITLRCIMKGTIPLPSYHHISYAIIKDRTAGSAEIGLEMTRRLVGVPGVEPGTSSLSGTRSNQLSYGPESQW